MQGSAKGRSTRSGAAGRTVSLGEGKTTVSLAFEDLCRHTMIFGSSGAGKTTRAYNPILTQMLGDLGAGALIIAPKSEAAAEAAEIARRAGRDVLLIQPGSEFGLDLLSGSPDVDAIYFRDALGQVAEDAKQFVEAAVSRMKNALRILLAAGSQYYTFEHLTAYCFDDKYAAMVRVHASDRMRAIPHDSDEAWTIREAMTYEDTRFNQFTPETRRGVQFAVSQLLEPLRDVQIARTFSRKANMVPMESVFDGKVIVLHVPRSEYDRAAAAIYTMAKRRFFTAMEKRRANPALDQMRPVVFAIDEYQLCVSESDVLSLGVIRSAGCMVLATTHGVSSLYSVLPRHQVDAALQNFSQKIFFKTDDHDTLAVLERTTRHTAGKLDAGLLFAMTRDEALCHLTMGDDSIDDVLTLRPLFISPDYFHGAPALESVA
jgi:type IV secretory pathway TraG/TraD family ATPase VirD4